ncbi:hypothetical protein OH76DRAFT_174359 [Lentinus brumalis]|uniref:Uncharacterized protein n=1 Tax=Lentinus brumalis TaxID=2498619 RepID=A0A371CNQ4_9APHY|nr:hypothetical protein OH76DRAFT_174359 [Polyporus brumalis]
MTQLHLLSPLRGSLATQPCFSPPPFRRALDLLQGHFHASSCISRRMATSNSFGSILGTRAASITSKFPLYVFLAFFSPPSLSMSLSSRSVVALCDAPGAFNLGLKDVPARMPQRHQPEVRKAQCPRSEAKHCSPWIARLLEIRRHLCHPQQWPLKNASAMWRASAARDIVRAGWEEGLALTISMSLLKQSTYAGHCGDVRRSESWEFRMVRCHSPQSSVSPCACRPQPAPP